ncbi:MAG: MMPL family transporter [Anaerolineae bacterium]|nr:MMPL family transporter [Anaerolineae bacterium]
MIFEQIGKIAVRWRYAIIGAWIAAVVIVTLIAPNLSDVATSDQSVMLPADAPFRHELEVYQEAFPASSGSTSMVIVVQTDDDLGILNQANSSFDEQIDTPTSQYISQLVEWLNGEEAPESIINVISPVSSEQVADMTVDESNEIAMIPVNLSMAAADTNFSQIVTEPIREWIDANQPDGVASYITGAQPVLSAFSDAAISTAESTLVVTVGLVIVLLLLIYRSPVSPLIPLSVVTVSYLITRGLVAMLADGTLIVSSYADILLVVVIYGAGTDYCLFLISRFREEVADNSNIHESTVTTIEKVGETITSSAGTIFVGFTAMVFAEFGLFNTSGPALAIGIIVALLAGLTLVPAILSVLGNRAFWPGKATHRSSGRFYKATSNLVAQRPLLVIVVVVGLMLPLGIYGLSAPLNYSTVSDLPNDLEAKQGYQVLERSLGPGNLSPLTVTATDRDPETMSAEIARLEADLMALDGVADVMSLNNPTGQSGEFANILQVDGQLRLIATMMSSTTSGGAIPDLQSATSLLQGMATYFNNIADRFPEVTDDPNLVTLQEAFASPLTFFQKMSEVEPALEALATRFESVENPYMDITELADLVPADSDMAGADAIAQLLDRHLSEDRTSYRMDVILAEDPNSAEGLDAVLQIRELLPAYENGGEAVVTGQPAIIADLRDTLDYDLVLTIGVVSLGIFIVLLLMLRSLIAPIYLIATVGLSYIFTLGITQFAFSVVLGTGEGLSFIIPVFAFVFLVALGVDYSIFLIGRVKEEVGHRGILDGVHEAVVATGPIITSAGIILAGTFASMVFGDITALAQLGFAVAVGVLIDTFIVRTMLVPAITILLGKWAWWPGGVPQAKS